MSYCRWSSDHWRSDVYCYESDRGYETHVAGNRVVGEIPKEPGFAALRDADTVDSRAAWLMQHQCVIDFLSTAERAPIGLPHDGASFTDPDLPSFLVTLEMLKAEGYNVPSYVFDDIRAEMVSHLKTTDEP
jgi:hypothetical protein